MRKVNPIRLFLWLHDKELYMHTQLSAGYNFDTKQSLDPTLGEYFRDFLKICSHQKPDAAIPTDISEYTLFDWDTRDLSPSMLFSQIQLPRIVFAIHADNPLEQAARLRMYLETLPEPKKDLDTWFKEIQWTSHTSTPDMLPNFAIDQSTHFHAAVAGSNFAVHSSNTTQRLEPSPEIRSLLASIEAAIRANADLSERRRAEALSDVAILNSELARERPRKPVVNSILATIGDLSSITSLLMQLRTLLPSLSWLGG